MKILAAAIVLGALLIAGAVAYSAYENSKPTTRCFKLRQPLDNPFDPAYKDVIRCVRK